MELKIDKRSTGVDVLSTTPPHRGTVEHALNNLEPPFIGNEFLCKTALYVLRVKTCDQVTANYQTHDGRIVGRRGATH